MPEPQLTRRIETYARGRRIAAVLGALPLLGVYLLVHTPWLNASLQDHRHLVVALLIGVPLGWLLLLVQAWRRLGPRMLGLACPACHAPLPDPAPPPPGEVLRCARCDAPLMEAAARG